MVQIELKIHLEKKSNVQKESNSLQVIKGNKRVKWTYELSTDDD